MIENTNTEPITVLIVDDHPVFRQGLESLVGTQEDMRVVGAVDNASEALTRAASEPPDLILLDLRLADTNGLEILTEIQLLPKPPKVLIVSSHEGDAMVSRALKAGAGGYVSKNAPASELLSAIRKVHSGIRALSKDISRNVAASIGLPTLTPREVEIIEQVSAGMSNKEVAAHLGLSEKTVKNHLNSVFVKLDASDRTHAVMLAIERGIIGPHPA